MNKFKKMTDNELILELAEIKDEYDVGERMQCITELQKRLRELRELEGMKGD